LEVQVLAVSRVEEAKTEIRDALLRMVTEDFTGLGELPALLKVLFPELSMEERKSITLEVVGQLLQDRMIRAGKLDDAGGKFIGTDLTADEVVAAMDQEWQRIGRDPHIGEIFWLDTVD